MTTLKQRIVERINAEGPMPFEEFQRLCLYDPDGGFFATGPLRSTKSGDFLTSPEVSPWFGRMLARHVEQIDEHLGRPGDIVEVGAGSGSLLASLLDELREERRVWAVEIAPAARAALRELERVGVVDGIADLPDVIDGTVIANELLDNLPVAVVRCDGGAFYEQWVGYDGESLELVATPMRPAVAEWVEKYAGPVIDGGLVEVQLEAASWLREMLVRLRRGALLVIDYGGTTEELEPRRSAGTLRTYRAHHLGPDPLNDPGATDITVDVNFTALVDVAMEAASVTMLRQDDFLERLGLREVIAELRSRELALARSGDEMQRLVVRSELRDADTLLHPRGLGDFRVLVATK